MKLINHLPTKSNIDQKTLYKLWHGRKPMVKYIRVFGCVVHQRIPKEVRQRTHDDQKFEACAMKMIHVGSSLIGYHLYDPLPKSIKIPTTLSLSKLEITPIFNGNTSSKSRTNLSTMITRLLLLQMQSSRIASTTAFQIHMQKH